MRMTTFLAAALLLTPATVIAPAVASGLQATQSTDISAAKKKKQSAKPKEEYLKAAPGTGPSGPKK